MKDEVPPNGDAVDEECLELEGDDREVEDLHSRPHLPVLDEGGVQVVLDLLDGRVDEPAEGRDGPAAGLRELAEEEADARQPALDDGETHKRHGSHPDGKDGLVQDDFEQPPHRHVLRNDRLDEAVPLRRDGREGEATPRRKDQNALQVERVLVSRAVGGDLADDIPDEADHKPRRHPRLEGLLVQGILVLLPQPHHGIGAAPKRIQALRFPRVRGTAQPPARGWPPGEPQPVG
eukprot:CAMPEP_0206240282 /NCGR_PEP_ID=MMETSP0047_2-20121206/15854_1 /ASSEMBLY_ACC=CAM_ASM_000192 /TAXON_ID=195065 /ORGANISM="Chroomonas mesostigmatica_cf, Strain CCMP1168" /LENGTH=233 /DNA_ID=CAMNT_0053665051 /DNA_START=369 /DNA_END=1071 /DNA_ORIENTATION=+